LYFHIIQDDPFKGFKTINLQFAKKAEPTFSLDEKIAAARKKRKKEVTHFILKAIDNIIKLL
jgi:hypothetical protein